MMQTNKILVDTSFVYGSYDHGDKYYNSAIQWIKTNPSATLVMPDVVLVEATYLIRENMSVSDTIRFLKSYVPNVFELECVSSADVERASEIMLQYMDAKLDFVDCIISTQAERFNIAQICTFDRRDFSIMKPRHILYFELLP
jgi:uncharacterized protein